MSLCGIGKKQFHPWVKPGKRKEKPKIKTWLAKAFPELKDSELDTLIELNAKLERLLNGIDSLSANQERMCEDISKIKEAVYNPDQGLYARIRQLEAWKATSTKLIWTLFTAMTGLVSAVVLKYLP